MSIKEFTGFEGEKAQAPVALSQQETDQLISQYDIFRKAKKKRIEMPEVEHEVNRLLALTLRRRAAGASADYNVEIFIGDFEEPHRRSRNPVGLDFRQSALTVPYDAHRIFAPLDRIAEAGSLRNSLDLIDIIKKGGGYDRVKEDDIFAVQRTFYELKKIRVYSSSAGLQPDNLTKVFRYDPIEAWENF